MADYTKNRPNKIQNLNATTNKKHQQSSSPAAVFNRSMTINSSSSSPSAAAVEMANKPLYNLYNNNHPTFQRNGSVKTTSYSSNSFTNSFRGKVMKLRSIFESPKHPSTGSPNSNSDPSFSPNSKSAPPDSPFWLPGTEDRVVIYFTSLRGVRRTFQDCHAVRMIFRGFRVSLDERDVSMDAAYRREFHSVLGEKQNVALPLPQVFIRGKYIGGAEVVKQLLEVGELARMLKGLPLRPPKACEACDDVRFIPCSNCSGSRKVFDEDEEAPRRCSECNENGLVRCPLCSS